MNWIIIITLTLLAFFFGVRAIGISLGRARAYRLAQEKEDAYMERWSTWAEQTKVGP